MINRFEKAIRLNEERFLKIMSVCMEELQFINNIIKNSNLYPEDKIIKLCRYLLFNNKQSGLELIKVAFKL